MGTGGQHTDATRPQQPGNGANGGANGDGTQLRYLVGGAAVLQAVLASVGVSNGGISAMLINYRVAGLIGLGAVFAAIVIGALGLINAKGKLRTALGFLGTVLLFVGIGVTGYAALVVPAVAKAPNINVALARSGAQLVLTAHVKASGIPESEEYWIEIDAREYLVEPGARGAANGGRYVQLGTPLYQQQLGADSQGNIDSLVTVPLPAGSYPAVSVEAWDGAHEGPCGSLDVLGGANLTHSPETKSNLEDVGRSGCVVVRLPR
jgi:hypothetical protein